MAFILQFVRLTTFGFSNNNYWYIILLHTQIQKFLSILKGFRKYRKKSLYGLIKRDLRDVFHRLATQKECVIESGHIMPDHVHMLISIPPKHSIAAVVGFLKGKSSIWVAQNISNRQKNFVGHKFWARGYFVSTVGANEEVVKKYIANQEDQDKRSDSLNLFNR